MRASDRQRSVHLTDRQEAVILSSMLRLLKLLFLTTVGSPWSATVFVRFPEYWEDRDRRLAGVYWIVNLHELMSFRFSERASPKNQGEKWWRKTADQNWPLVSTNIHMHAYAPIHICAHVTNTHTHTHKPQEKSVLHHKGPSIST